MAVVGSLHLFSRDLTQVENKECLAQMWPTFGLE